MPAVINTGGPRVLHCVERADCPIPRSQPILSSQRISHRSYTVRKQQPRFSNDALQRRCNDGVAVLCGSCFDETANIHGNDERDEFFNDETSQASISSTSSNDLTRLVARTERIHRYRDRKHYDALQRRQNNRRKRLRSEIHTSDRDVESSTNHRDIYENNEIELRDEATSTVCPVVRTLHPGTSTILREKEPRGSSGTTAGHLTRPLRYNEPDEMEHSSDIVMRLFGGCDLERERETMYGRVEKTSAAISSQRVLNCADYEWQCECLSSTTDGTVSMKTARESEITTRERRKSHRSRDQYKERSYVQLALLLFLVAFGHGNLFKTNFGFFGGKTGVMGGGLGVLTIGTIVGAVRAVPVDLDAGVRAERSANLSHITGASRKIQMYIKNRHLQILRDGTVNGSNDDTSEYNARGCLGAKGLREEEEDARRNFSRFSASIVSVSRVSRSLYGLATKEKKKIAGTATLSATRTKKDRLVRREDRYTWWHPRFVITFRHLQSFPYEAIYRVVDVK